MSETAGLLRPDLLSGVSVLVAGAAEPAGSLGGAVSAACAELGARVSVCAADAFADEAAVEERVGAALAEVGGLDLLVVDGADLFARESARDIEADGRDEEGDGSAGGEDAGAALSACLDATWNVTRAVANLAFLTDGGRGGRVLLLAPPPDAGPHAEAARAGLENLARTLSIEWARRAITLVAIAPGTETAAGEVAALCAYLASPAGAYFSGCLLDLRGP
jgi:NAD(P)-dependent dehydrogenase (short-subunit alcohol dehydrogenase family)